MIKLVNSMDPCSSDRRRPTASGTRYRQIFTYDSVNDDLVPQGRVDRYADIQSYRDDVDINSLFERINYPYHEGPYAREGFYGDVTDVPETIHDLAVQSEEINEVVNKIADVAGLTPADVLGCIDDDEAFRGLCSMLSRSTGEMKKEESEAKPDVEE